MCQAPLRLADGTEVACHECPQCRDRAIADWTGRNIAESKTSKACHVVRLSYGRSALGDVDHERSALLTYSDVQKFFKLLRRHGYPMRYFVTGEYGSERGRAHWHAIIYWLDKVPEVRLEDNYFEYEHWPHGFSYWEVPRGGTVNGSIRYVCKYVQKDIGVAERQGHLAMSKKPPLGAAYFRRYAERYVAKGLAPQDLFYSFAEATKRNRKSGVLEPIQFMLSGRSAELFLQHYCDVWDATHPGRDYPRSELLEAFLVWGVVSIPKTLAHEGRLNEAKLGRYGWRDPVAMPTREECGVWRGKPSWVAKVSAWEARGRYILAGKRFRWTRNEKSGRYWWREIGE